MDPFRVLEVRLGPGCLIPHGSSIRVAYSTVVAREKVGTHFLCYHVTKHTTHNFSGETLYRIQGADEWLSEKAFDRRCQAIPRSLSRVSSSAEAAGHQGPLRGPGPLDNRLFPPEGDPR
jgi:hypothetical protein